MRDRDGGPVADMYVVVFAEDPKAWFQHSRRVAAVRPREDGRYTISNLPPGDYFIAVTSDLENNEWFDPEKLQALRGEASRVAIGENQSVRRDIGSVSGSLEDPAALTAFAKATAVRRGAPRKGGRAARASEQIPWPP